MPKNSLTTRRLGRLALAATSLLLALVTAAPATAAPDPTRSPAPSTATPVALKAVKLDRVRDMVHAKKHLFVSAGDEVRVLDENGRTRKRLKHLPGAGGMVVSARGERVYVAVRDAGLVVAVDSRTLKIVKRFKVGECPTQVALAGGRLFYASDGCTAREPSIASIDPLKGGTPVSSGIPMVDEPVILVGAGTTLVTSPSGELSSVVKSYRVSGATVTRTATLVEDSYVYGLALSPDGATVYVPHTNPGQVRAFPTATLTDPVTYDAGSLPLAVAVSPDGRRLAVALSDPGPDLLAFSVGADSPSFVGSTVWPDVIKPEALLGTLTFSDDGKKVFELLGDVFGEQTYLATTRAPKS